MRLDRVAGLTRIGEDIKRIREARPVRPRTASTLTAKEAEVLELVGLGFSNREIGEALGISHMTVRCHVKRVHDKTAVEGRARLAVAASRSMEG